MAKPRYFYYLIVMNSLINIINFVPRELIDRRFEGALMSIVISVIVGTLFVYWFGFLISKFPAKGIPEILGPLMPKLLVSAILLFFAVLWYVAGATTLLSFVDITLRFISPDTGPYLVMGGFLIMVCICCRFDSLSLLFGLEIILAITLPLILYATFKALGNPNFSWDAVLQIGTHFWHAPDWMSLAAATFSFSGYINLIIYNRVFQNLKLKHIWFVGIQGLLVLLVTFFVPIGYFGTVGVERHVYTWFATADSIQIESFLIERMLFIFYFAYMSLSLVSAITHWHVGLMLFQSVFSTARKTSARIKRWKEWGILGMFSAVTMYLMRLNQDELNTLGELFLQVRWYLEMFVLVLLFYCYRKEKRRTA